MPRSTFERLVLRHTLSALAPNELLRDAVMSGPQADGVPFEIPPDASEEDARVLREFRDAIHVPTRQVCVRVNPALYDRIDHVCHLLDVQKRAFLEASFVDACQKAEEIMEAEGLLDVLRQEEEL